MTIAVGDKLPEATFKVRTPEGLKDLTTRELTAGKKVVLFAVPGAFTPTCHARHLPSYLEHLDALKAKGVDTVACVAVNDAFVLDAWGKNAGADGKIKFWQLDNRRKPRTLEQVEGARLFMQAAQDVRLGGRPTRTQFEFTLQDANLAELNEWAPKILAKMQTLPELRDVATDQQAPVAKVDPRILAGIGKSQDLAPEASPRQGRGLARDEGLARGRGLAAIGREVGIGGDEIETGERRPQRVGGRLIGGHRVAEEALGGPQDDRGAVGRDDDRADLPRGRSGHRDGRDHRPVHARHPDPGSVDRAAQQRDAARPLRGARHGHHRRPPVPLRRLDRRRARARLAEGRRLALLHRGGGTMSPIKVLVVEDGDEYITNLTTFVSRGIAYTQAKSGGVACVLLGTLQPDLVYLDMRFDRTPNEALLGDLLEERSANLRYYRGEGISESTLDRVESHGFRAMYDTYDQSGFFGEGLGTATPGSHHLQVERPRVWQESTSSRILVELGVPGTFGFLIVMATIVFNLWKVTIRQLRARSPQATYAAGLVAFFLANVGSLAVSGQILSDPFIAAFLGFLVGMTLSTIRLRAPGQAAAQPDRTIVAAAAETRSGEALSD